MDNICIFIFRVCDNFVILINIYLLDLLKLVRQKSMVHYGFLLQNLHCYKCQGLRGSVLKFFFFKNQFKKYCFRMVFRYMIIIRRLH